MELPGKGRPRHAPSTTAIPTVLGRKAPLNATGTALCTSPAQIHRLLQASPRALKQTYRLFALKKSLRIYAYFPSLPKRTAQIYSRYTLWPNGDISFDIDPPFVSNEVPKHNAVLACGYIPFHAL